MVPNTAELGCVAEEWCPEDDARLGLLLISKLYWNGKVRAFARCLFFSQGSKPRRSSICGRTIRQK